MWGDPAGAMCRAGALVGSTDYTKKCTRPPSALSPWDRAALCSFLLALKQTCEAWPQGPPGCVDKKTT
eukprot:4286192-Prymnesium_polylepis.1